MAFEDIKIIIKKNGEIWVDLGNLPPQKIKRYKDIFEEAIGPVKGEIASADRGGGYGGVLLTGDSHDLDEDQEKEWIKNGG